MDRIAYLEFVLLVAASIAVASPRIATRVRSADPLPPIRVDIEAMPSEEAFPSSSLQQSELEETFTQLCPHCRLVADVNEAVDFLIEVEDPGFGWRLRLFEGRNHLAKTLEWEGPLELGLTVAVWMIQDARLNSRLEEARGATREL